MPRLPSAPRARRLAVFGLAILGAALLSACGPREEKLYRVSGRVTADGKPVPKGLIHFENAENGQHGFANILDGAYDTAQASSGVRGGKYNIRVNAFDGREANEAPFGQPLFPEYNATADLPAADSTYDLNIPKSGR